MLTKGAIGNLVNRYRAVLKKCNLINTFGSLAVASMFVLGNVGVANALILNNGSTTIPDTITGTNATNATDTLHAMVSTGATSLDATHVTFIDVTGLKEATAAWAYDGGSIELGSANNDLTIHVNATGASTSSAKALNVTKTGSSKPSSTMVVNAKHLEINSYADIDARGINSALNSNQGYIDTNSYLIINAEKTTITANSGSSGSAHGIVAHSGAKIVINGDLTIRANNGSGNVIAARGSEIFIGSDTKKETVQLDGHILFAGEGYNVDSKIDITLEGENSYWNGSIYANGNEATTVEQLKVNNMVLRVVDGARWTPFESVVAMDATSLEKTSIALSNLVLDGGNVEIKSGIAAQVKNLSGSGNINMVDATGSFAAATVSDDAALNVQAITEDGTVKTADEVDTATLEAMMAKVEGVSEDKLTASTPDGIVNAGFTTDSEGKIVSGGGASSVTKAVLEAASVNTVALDRILTNDVRKRLGDIRSDANKTGVWMRWDGGKLKGNGLTNEFNTIQIGGDTKVAKNCRLGVAGSFTHGDGDFARGSSELEGFSFAAYATWMGENGMFADVVARIGHFSTEVNVEGQSGDMDNRVASISGEYGWRFNLCQQFFIEPQVELAYTYVNSDDLELETAKFSFDSVDSLTGRVGLVAGWNLPDDRGNVYARASVVQQFMGDAKVTGFSSVAPTVHETDGDDTWLEYGIGANVKLTDNTYIWADVERTEGADIDEEWRGTVGVRFSF